MKKQFSMLMVLMLCLVFFAACGNQQNTPPQSTGPQQTAAQEPEKVELTFWGYDGAPEYGELFEKYIESFESAHPGVTVNYLGLPFDDAKSKFDMSIATGTFPDVAFIGSSWTSSFAMAKGLLPLDDYYNAWKSKDNAIEQFFNTGVLYGKRYAVPIDATLYGVWYRPDWYAEKGLTPPKTFDEFFDNIKALNDPQNGRYGFTIRGGGGGSHQMEGFLLSYVGTTSYFDENGKSYARDPKALEGFKRYVGLYGNYTPTSDVNNGYRDMANVFGSGVASTMCHNISSYPMHETNLGKGKYSMFVLPKADNGTRTVAFCGVAATSHLVVSSTTKSADKAWAFVDHLLSDGIHSDWVKNLALFPVTQSVSKESWVNEIQSLTEVRSVLAEEDTVFLEAPFYLPDFEDIHINTLQPGLQEVMLGKKTPEDYMNEYAAEMEQSLANYNNLTR